MSAHRHRWVVMTDAQRRDRLSPKEAALDCCPWYACSCGWVNHGVRSDR